MTFKRLTLSFFVFGCIVACEKEELPVPAHQSGDVRQASVDMGVNYEYQVFYDLQSNKVISKNRKDIWDLAFESTENGSSIILNSSKLMFAFDTQIMDFESVDDTSGLEKNKKWDHPSGDLNKTAIGEWQKSKHVYVLDRGIDVNGLHQGFVKVQFLSVDKNSFSLRYAELNGNGDTIVVVQKNSDYNFTFLSLDAGNQVMVEPPKSEWDVVFTQYTYIFYEPYFIHYLVTGCLSNRYKTLSVRDSLTSFDAVDYRYAQNAVLSEDINAIGYDWKNFNGRTYEVDQTNLYILKDSDGIYYKLHFLDFYGPQGNKGEPQWEFQML